MALRFLFRKGAIETITYLYEVGRANYYAIQRQGFVGSRPLRVEYSLTEKGKRAAEILEELKTVLNV